MTVIMTNHKGERQEFPVITLPERIAKAAPPVLGTITGTPVGVRNINSLNLEAPTGKAPSQSPAPSTPTVLPTTTGTHGLYGVDYDDEDSVV